MTKNTMCYIELYVVLYVAWRNSLERWSNSLKAPKGLTLLINTKYEVNKGGRREKTHTHNVILVFIASLGTRDR